MGKSQQWQKKSELVHNKKYLKAKIKSDKGKINTKECSQCIYIPVILIDSVYRKDKRWKNSDEKKYIH